MMKEEEAQAGSRTGFWEYVQPVAMVTSFRYQGRILTATENDWAEFVRNIRKVRRSWASSLRILRREEVDTRTLGWFYLVAVQEIIIIISETWVATPYIRYGPGEVPPLGHEADYREAPSETI